MAINYAAHRLHTPDHYHRRYDVDLRAPPSSECDLMRRVGTAVLPLLALYKPIGSVLSIGMNSWRFVTHLGHSLYLQGQDERSKVITELAVAAAAAASLAASILQSTVGLFLSTASDVGFGLSQMVWHGPSIAEGAQTLSSLLYLGFMVTGSLEVILLSCLVQGLYSLYEAKDEFDQGHYIEATCKAILAGVKGHQVHEYRKLIQRRDTLFAARRYQQLVARAQRAKAAGMLEGHPLSDLDAMVQKRVILSSADQEYDFGAQLHGYGQGLVKGNNLQLRRVQVEGKSFFQLDFKLNHAFRDELAKTLGELSKCDPKELQEVFRLTGCSAEGLSVQREGSFFRFFDFCFSEGREIPEYVMQVPGVGKVSVGASSMLEKSSLELPNLYDKVSVRVEEGKSLYEMRELLTFLDLDKALASSSREDTERLKLGHLFHAFFPKEALSIERNKEFFELSTADLKGKMIEKAPGMRKVYDTYFHRMKLSEILPGRMRYQIEGLSDAVRERGVECLTSAVTGADDDNSLFSRVSSMLQMGMCSSELRDQGRVGKEGLSRGFDYMSGSADSVFTQLVLKENPKEGYWSRIKMRLSLKALELGSYQSLWDSYGSRSVKEGYSERLNILDFVDEIKNPGYGMHEVMLKERIAPHFIEGLDVCDETTRQNLIAHLRKEGFIQRNLSGEETLLGHLLSTFITVRG